MIARHLVFTCLLLFMIPGSSRAWDSPVQKWADIFQPSVLNSEERIAELNWFRHAAQDLRGVKVRSTAEHIETHYWESRVLARAFRELTGIEVTHDVIGEGQVVDRITDQIENDVIHYHIYVNDADMIGTHLRSGGVVDLTSYMAGAGAPFTNPHLDLDDFLNLEFGQDYDGRQLQLPDQQFANLYWFRHDWFSREDIKEQFRSQYGYELGVPMNWEAYEDIAEFFTNTPVDGTKVYGHLDYGKPSPSLGWRFTDAWFSIAGVGDVGLPNGLPVDEWGVRVEERIPVGSSVSRGGAVNGPAAVYALEKYIDWLRNFAPPESLGWDWQDAGPKAARGDVAQCIFQYVTWLSDPAFHSPRSPVCDKHGLPKWRVAPTPHGRYWDSGMKVGYQDAGSWTIPKNVLGREREAAWLWAQFCVSKTVSLKKFTVGGTPVRKSTVNSDYLTENMAQYGGLIEFYRSGTRYLWTDSGPNVPYYPGMSKLWWRNIARAISGEATPQEALDELARQQDELMGKMELERYSPQLNPEKAAEEWLSAKGAPKAKRQHQEPRTIPYDELVKEWTR